MALRIVEKAGLSDVGRQRQGNEDAFLESAPTFAVADGMGGARAGEVASRIAVEAFDAERDAGSSPEQQLVTIARAANRRIHRMAQEDEAYAGMGTTLTAVIVGERELAVGHVGDSRLYRMRDGTLERLTRDHSLVEELVRAGQLSPEAAEEDPRRSIITRALGPEPEVQVDTFTAPARDGDVFLICSDGLTGMVAEDLMVDVLRGAPSLEAAARELVAAANANGGRDNITVVLFRLSDSGDAEAEQDTLTGREDGLDAEHVRAAAATRVTGPEEHPERGEGRAALAERAPPTPARPSRPLPVAEERDARAAGAVRDDGRAAPPPGGRPTEGRGRARGLLRLGAVVVVAAAALGALIWGSRQVYWVGTSERGLLTLERGLPYSPLGLSLSSRQYESAVPAGSLPARQREFVLDRELRGRADARDLIGELEAARRAQLEAERREAERRERERAAQARRRR